MDGLLRAMVAMDFARGLSPRSREHLWARRGKNGCVIEVGEVI